LVERHGPLDLIIGGNNFEEPLTFAESLANSVHLESVGFFRLFYNLTTDGACIVRTLLSPQSRLEKLILSAMPMTDRYFRQIVDMLPPSQLRVLDVSDNSLIGVEGRLELARQLPNIKHLKELDLSCNSWERIMHHWYEKCTVAFLEGMFENSSIEHFRLGRRVEELEYLTESNRIRGQILATGLSIPMGLWPLILEQVGSRQWDRTWGQEVKFRNHRINALYFALHNCPILSTVSLRIRRARKRSHGGKDSE